MRYNEYTDGDNIYYVSALIGRDVFAVCKKKIGSKKFGIHRYRGCGNKPVDTPEAAQEYLESLAVKKGWQLYFE